MKRREAERQIEEREERIMQEKKVEADRLYHLYQDEKERQRMEKAQAVSHSHLNQIVSQKFKIVSI